MCHKVVGMRLKIKYRASDTYVLPYEVHRTTSVHR